MNLGSPKHQRKICVKHFMSRRFFFSNPSLKGTKSRFWQYLFFAYLGVLVRCCFVEFWIRNEIKCWFDLHQLIIGVLFSLTTFKGILTTNKLIEIASITQWLFGTKKISFHYWRAPSTLIFFAFYALLSNVRVNFHQTRQTGSQMKA